MFGLCWTYFLWWLGITPEAGARRIAIPVFIFHALFTSTSILSFIKSDSAKVSFRWSRIIPSLLIIGISGKMVTLRELFSLPEEYKNPRKMAKFINEKIPEDALIVMGGGWINAAIGLPTKRKFVELCEIEPDREVNKQIYFLIPTMQKAMNPFGYYSLRHFSLGRKVVSFGDEELYEFSGIGRFDIHQYYYIKSFTPGHYTHKLDLLNNKVHEIQIGPGIYPYEEGKGRWVSKRGSIWIKRPKNSDRLFIKGFVPTEHFGKNGLKIDIVLNGGKYIQKNNRLSGEFRITIPVPDSLYPSDYIHITLLSDKEFCIENCEKKVEKPEEVDFDSFYLKRCRSKPKLVSFLLHFVGFNP